MTSSTTTKIILYEDNPDMREGLSTLIAFSKNLELAGSFINCSDCDAHVEALQPDIILMDIEMPETNGLEGIRKIRAVNKTVKIIVLTVFDDNQNVFDAICGGANGYLLKKSSPKQITDAISEALAGGAPMTPSIANKVLKLLADSNLSAQQKQDYGLTAKEKMILQSLVNGNSYKMIAVEQEIAIDTVKSHLKKIYQKLQVHSQTEAVAKALRNRIV
ncbi:MAG TPA: response regulator transcription factor [Chitinophagaceae bacterium]|nr:response regulator transcription factor [Chitinophagaceae bacterium]